MYVFSLSFLSLHASNAICVRERVCEAMACVGVYFFPLFALMTHARKTVTRVFALWQTLVLRQRAL